MHAYAERLTWPLWFHLALAFVIASSLAGGVSALSRGAVGAGLVPVLVAACVGLVWWRMRVLCLEVRAEGVRFGFGKPGRLIPADRVRSMAAEEYSAVRYMGWGYRLGWGWGDRAYSIPGYRRGVRIVYVEESGRERRVFVACSDPAAASAALSPA